MSKQYVRSVSSIANVNEINANVIKLADCVEGGEVKVTIQGDDPSGHGLATEAKQDDMISLLEGQTPALNRPKAIPVQIMVGDAGGSFDALRANGQDLLVMIDDMNPDVAVNSGLARSDKQDDQITKLTEIDTAIDSIDGKISKGNSATGVGESLQQVLIYGKKPDGTLQPLETVDDRLLVDVVELTTQAQITNLSVLSAVQVCGFDTSTSRFKTIKCDGNGALIVDNSADSIITADGVTQEQRVMIHGNYNGNLRTVKVGSGGALATELDHSWDNTNQIFNAEACADGATIESSIFDLGQGISHEPDRVQFFLDNSASVDIEVKGLASYDGTNFYESGNASTINSSKGSIYFSQEDVGIGSGHRYLKLSVTNNNGLGTSTNISCQVGYYK